MDIKDKFIASFLSILLGVWGVHWFYLNNRTRGFIYLSCSILLCWTGIVPLIIYILSIIDCIHFITMEDKIFDNIYNEGKHSTIFSSSNATELKKYKELLDDGGITQEEYDKKKNELL